MPLSVISIGQKPPQWCIDAVNEYTQKLKHFTKIDCFDLPLSIYHKRKEPLRAKKEEGKAIQSTLPKDSHVVVLDENGKSFTSLALSEKINQWQLSFNRISFVIGGPAGLDKKCLEAADTIWSLSKLTLPHRMVKIILLEQLYRAYSILNNHPYHRE